LLYFAEIFFKSENLIKTENYFQIHSKLQKKYFFPKIYINQKFSNLIIYIKCLFISQWLDLPIDAMIVRSSWTQIQHRFGQSWRPDTNTGEISTVNIKLVYVKGMQNIDIDISDIANDQVLQISVDIRPFYQHNIVTILWPGIWTQW